MHGLAPLVYDLTLMLGVAGIVVLLFQRIHQPVVLGYLVAGVLIGPHVLPFIINGILVAILFTVVDHLLSPRLNMLFSFKHADLPSYGRATRTPAVFIIWLVSMIN